jgi:hypothetical protein
LPVRVREGERGEGNWAGSGIWADWALREKKRKREDGGLGWKEKERRKKFSFF